MGAAASVSLEDVGAQYNEIWHRLQKECHGVVPAGFSNPDEAKSLREALIKKYDVYLAHARNSSGSPAQEGADVAFSKLKADFIDLCIGTRETTALRGLDYVVDAVVYTNGRWPLVWDPSGQAAKFFKYQGGVYLRAEDPRDMQPESLRAALVGCLQHGNALCIDLGRNEEKQIFDFFVDTFFPQDVLCRELLYTDAVLNSILRPAQGDPDPQKFLPRDEFRLVIVTSAENLPRLTAGACAVVEVLTQKSSRGAEQGKHGVALQTQEDRELQEAFGLRETIRNSKELVEAGFEGDIAAIESWLTKDYHIESRDGQRATCLSEASCAGKLDCVRMLLERGAEPNTTNVRDRTPLFRAAYHGHAEVCQLLLDNGADPDIAASDPPRPRRPQEVARTPELKTLLTEWDRTETKFRMAERRKLQEAALMQRCRTAAERAMVAKAQLRAELVKLATDGDIDSLTVQLDTLAQEAEELDEKPRANAQARDERGHTLLAIATWKGHTGLVEKLCSHWEQFKCPEDSFLDENRSLREAWRVNVNARNCQGWTPVALAVFHDHAPIVRILLAHGADPTKRNSRRLSPFQLAAEKPVILETLRQWGEDHKLGVHEMDTSMATAVVDAGNPLAAIVSQKKKKTGKAKKTKGAGGASKGKKKGTAAKKKKKKQ